MLGIAKWAAPLAAAVSGLFLYSASPARAYDLNDCNRVLATFAIQQFSINGGGADFGDLPHLGGGPLGTAVICWSPGGRVAVIGKLFADDLCLPFRDCTPLTATLKIRFRRTNGQFSPTVTLSLLSQGNLAFGEVKRRSSSGNFNRVNLRLFTFQQTALGSTGNVLVAERNFDR